MINEFLNMGGYGFYIWTSFLLVTVFCFLLYYKTKKTLKKYEREFSKEINELSVEQKKIVIENSKVASQVLSSYSKTV